MSPEELPWLHDVFMSVGEDFDQEKTSYILQFLWRDLTSRFDVIGPYFTCASSWDQKFLLECVMRTIQAFTLYQFHVRVLVCDGASSKLALMKLLCGYEHEQLPLADGHDQFAVSASFQNPYEDDEDQRVFVVICPSHQVTCSEMFCVNSFHIMDTPYSVDTCGINTVVANQLWLNVFA